MSELAETYRLMKEAKKAHRAKMPYCVCCSITKVNVNKDGYQEPCKYCQGQMADTPEKYLGLNWYKESDER